MEKALAVNFAEDCKAYAPRSLMKDGDPRPAKAPEPSPL